MSSLLLIEKLQTPDLYDHPIQAFRVIETHISWVLLTGTFVYKIKKPLDLGFLDFSTLEKRHYYCQEEIRLNQRLSSEIYLGVVPITGTENNPHFKGDGEVIEYAVKMKEFPQSCLFDQLLLQNKLTPRLINEVAHILADFHLRIPKALADNPYGTAEQIHEPVVQNFEQVLPFLETADDKTRLAKISAWADNEHQRLFAYFQQRKEQGFIRECHADVHLGNITLVDDTPIIFDCVEFSPCIRWSDVMADIGFLIMDFEDYRRKDFAHRVTNQYFLYTGDYSALHVLPYYQSYRAMVRAKIALFQREQVTDTKMKATLLTKYHRCIELAENYMKPRQCALMITYGLTGSGKSHLAESLVDSLGCIQISSDWERKRLAGLVPTASTQSGVNEGLYDPAFHEKTYHKLLELAEQIIKAGYTVIVDASFIRQASRQLFADLAKRLNVPFIILQPETPLEIIKDRVLERQQRGNTISEARLDVLAMQQTTLEPLTLSEQAYVINIDVKKNTIKNNTLIAQNIENFFGDFFNYSV